MTPRQWFAALNESPCLLPAAERAKNGGETLGTLLSFYQQTEEGSTQDLLMQQEALLAELIRHSATYSPLFSKRLKEAKLKPRDLTRVKDLHRLPLLSRQAIAQGGRTIFCTQVPKEHGRYGTTSTSGSTGEPVTVRRTDLCQQHWAAHTIREHLWHQRDPSAKLAVIRADLTDKVVCDTWGRPMDLLFRTGPGAARPAVEGVDSLCEWLLDYQPNHLLVLPNVLAALLPLLEQAPRKLEALNAICTIGETLTPALRLETKRLFGVEIADIYSSQEMGVMAVQCPEYGHYHITETVLMEILREDGTPCSPGEVGRVVVTDLLNYATPLIRYAIGDYAEAGPCTCPCGRSSATVKRFLGRERNLVMRPDGTRHWPQVGFKRFSDLIPTIRQYQFIQQDRHTITARFSVATVPDEATQQELTRVIQTALGHEYTIDYEWMDVPLPRGARGKFEEFISLAV